MSISFARNRTEKRREKMGKDKKDKQSFAFTYL
jgi:hypothetical protein